MSALGLSCAFDQKAGSAVERCVLVAVGNALDSDNRAHVDLSKISEWSGESEYAVARALWSLIIAGTLEEVCEEYVTFAGLRTDLSRVRR